MKKNKEIALFLLKFFATYFILYGAYSVYLSNTQQKGDVFSCSPITQKVAQHAETMARFFGLDAEVRQNPDELSMMLLLNGQHIVNVVEGCSSVSIIILFLSFIIAFSGSFLNTLFFGIFGFIMIYLTNLARIVLLTVLYAKYPQYEYFLHSLLFPAIIYGMVFLLWIIWVKFFSYHNNPKDVKIS